MHRFRENLPESPRDRFIQFWLLGVISDQEGRHHLICTVIKLRTRPYKYAGVGVSSVHCSL
jgi:hypothetical protein